MHAALEPAPQPVESGPRKVVLVGAVIAAVLLGATGWFLAQRAQSPGRADAASTFRVCGSSITERLASDIVHGYAAQGGTSASAFHIEAAGNDVCSVRFRAALAGPGDQVIGRDGVVIVVNPANPLVRLSEEQVRDVFAGRITDWSRLGAPAGPIAVYLPADDSDEAQALAATLMHGTSVDAHVHRAASSAEIVRAVASASGRFAIGIASFSGAVPAKVLALGSAPPPSPLSIADRSYPMSVELLVGSDLRSPPAAASALLAFARSDPAQTIVGNAGAITKKGP